MFPGFLKVHQGVNISKFFGENEEFEHKVESNQNSGAGVLCTLLDYHLCTTSLCICKFEQASHSRSCMR